MSEFIVKVSFFLPLALAVVTPSRRWFRNVLAAPFFGAALVALYFLAVFLWGSVRLPSLVGSPAGALMAFGIPIVILWLIGKAIQGTKPE